MSTKVLGVNRNGCCLCRGKEYPMCLTRPGVGGQGYKNDKFILLIFDIIFVIILKGE